MLQRLLLLFSFTCLSFLSSAQPTISGTFSPPEAYTFGILYMIDVNNVFYRLDSSIKDGVFSVQAKEDMAPGMYRLVYDLPQTENFFDFIYNGKEDIAFTFSKEEGVLFTASKENQLWHRYKNGMDAFDMDLRKHYQENPVANDSIETLFALQSAYDQEFKNQAAGSIAEIFIKAYSPFISKEFKTEDAYQEAQKQAYFDAIDFSNPMLQRSGLPLELALKYVFYFADEADLVVSQQKNIDTLASKIANETDLFQQALLDNLWQFLVNNEQIAVANYLATNYLLPIAIRSNDEATVERLTLFKNLSIGAAAPNFSWEEEVAGKKTTQWLQDLDTSEQYLLIFWSSSCSHCLKEVPKIHRQLKEQPENRISVIAIGLEDEPYDWRNTIYDLPDFTHVLGLGKWENEIGNQYDISATPSYFVLNAEKKITHKPETMEELMDILALDK